MSYRFNKGLPVSLRSAAGRSMGDIASPPSGAGLSSSGSSPAVSTVPASIPDVWAVLDNYDYRPVEIVRETRSCVFYKIWLGNGAVWIEGKSMSAFPWRGDEAAARRLSDQLKSAKAEMNRRKTKADVWFGNRKRELLAQGIETRSAETERLSPQGESPVAESDAPND